MYRLLFLLILTQGLFYTSALGVPVVPNESFITGEVLEVKAIHSSVLNIQPKQTIYRIKVKIISATDIAPLLNFLKGKEKEIIILYSKEEPAAGIVGRTIEGKVSYRSDERGGLYWIRKLRINNNKPGGDHEKE